MSTGGRVGAVVGALLYGGSLFTVWCTTGSGTGLFGRPVSPVLIERFGVDYPIQCLAAAAALAVAAALTATRVAPRVGTLAALAVAAGASVRLVVGEHRPSSVGEVWLHGSWGLALAALAAWLVTGCSVAVARRKRKR